MRNNRFMYGVSTTTRGFGDEPVQTVRYKCGQSGDRRAMSIGSVNDEGVMWISGRVVCTTEPQRHDRTSWKLIKLQQAEKR